MFAGLCDGFGYGVSGGNLEEQRIRFGANDILHCLGVLLAGLGVLGNGEDDGGKIVGAPSVSDIIVGGIGGLTSVHDSCDALDELGSGAVRFYSLYGLNAEVYSMNAVELVE